uniref:Filaggrin family member 2 n=1 Tax=Pipistrellus kuhlii TaxID=59472 RepID=A0A7J7TVT5_PIPKU|nr:filaggrin family member 2 [Pipistrellus kuhlii]
MTDLLRSVVTVIDVFYKYTNQDGECGTLSKDDLKELLEKEFRPILKNPDNPDTVEVIMHMLDRDHDRRLDFTEFLLMVFKLAMACNNVLSKEYCKASGSKKQKRSHGHRHQKEGSETEEEDENTSGQKSGSKNPSWSDGEKHGHRHRSLSKRLGRQVNTGLAQVSPQALDNMGLAQVSPQALDNTGLAQVSPQALDNMGLAQVSPQALDNTGLAQVSPQALDNMDLAQVSPQALENMGLAQVSPQALDNMDLAQVSPQALENMGLAQVSPQALDNTGLAQVSPQALDNTGLAQVSPQALDNKDLAQVSPQALNNMGLAQVSPLVMAKKDLAQVSPQALENMALAQVSHLVLGNMGLVQVSPQALDNTGLAQVSPQALENMDLAQVSPQALENTGLAQVSPQALENMGLAQVSPQALDNMDLAQVSPQALENMDLAQVSPQALENTGLAQVSHLVLNNTGLAQVSPQALDNMDLAQVSPQALDNMDLAQVSPQALENMGLAQVSHLALDNMDLAQVSPQALENMGPAQVSHLVLNNTGLAQVSPQALENMGLAQVSPQALDNMDLAQVSPQALENMDLAQVSPQALENMGLAQVSHLALDNMDLAQLSPQALENTGLAQVSPQALENTGLAQVSPQALENMGLAQVSPQALDNRGLAQVSPQALENMGLAQLSPQALENTGLAQVSPQALENTGLAQVSHLVLNNTGLAQVSLQALENMDLAQVSLLAWTSMGLEEVNPVQHIMVEAGELVTRSPVAVNGIPEAHRDTQGPVMARLDLNMESGDPLVQGDRELLMDSQDTPAYIMAIQHSQDLTVVEEGDLVTVSPVTVNGIPEVHRDTQGPVMARLDLSMESGDPLVQGDRELLMDSQDTPAYIMAIQHSQDLTVVEEGDLVTVSPVAVNGIPEVHRDTQGPVVARLDLSMESRDPLVQGDRELLMDSQDTPAYIMAIPHSQDLTVVESGDLVTGSPVAVNGIPEAHRDTQGPVMARLDLSMESGDPLVQGDRELLMDSQDTPAYMGRQVMAIPHSQDLTVVEEGDLVTVSPVAVNGIPEAHRDTQGPVVARLDLSMESGDPLVQGDRELLMDSQDTPAYMGRQVMAIPHSQDLTVVESGDLVTGSPVAVNCIPEAHRDTQGLVMARLDLSMESGDPLVQGDRELLMDSQDTPAYIMAIPHSQDLTVVEEGNLVTVSPVAVNGIPEAHRDTLGLVMARLDLSMESGDPLVQGDKELLMDSQDIPAYMGRQVMAIPHSQDLTVVEDGDLVTVSPVTVNGIPEAHRDTQGPVMARLDLSMESGDPLVQGDRELLMDSQDTPVYMGRQVMAIPHSQDLTVVEEGDLVTVSPVAVNGIPEAHRDTQGPVMARLDLSMESGDPLVQGDKELLMDSQDTPAYMGRQVMAIPHSQDLTVVELGDLVTVSPVAVNGIPEAHRDTQGPVMARLDLSMESGDPLVQGDRELLMDSQDTLAYMGKEVMAIPHSQDLTVVESGDLVTGSPVAVNCILEAHRDTQGPVVARLDLSMESRDPLVQGDRELLMDSQDTPAYIMAIPHSQDLTVVESGDLVTGSPVAVNGIPEAHRDTQGPVMARLDLSMESGDPLVQGDRELLMDSQDTPAYMGRQVMAIPHSQDLTVVESGDLVTGSPVAVNGIPEAHRDTQGPVVARLDLSMESGDPLVQGDRELLMDSQDTPAYMGRQVMAIPHSQDLTVVESGDLVTGSPVAVNGIPEAHRDTQGPVVARLDLSMESGDPLVQGDRELLMDSQDTPAYMGRQVMAIPHSQDLTVVESGDLVTGSPVAVNGIPEAHRDTQGPVMARLDLSMESGDPLVQGDRELLMDSQDTPAYMGRQVMAIPHSQDLTVVEEGDLVTVSPVAVNGIPEAHRDTQGPVMARLDLSMESGDPLVQGDRELLMDSQDTPAYIMAIPHSQDLTVVEEGDLVTVSPVAVNGIPEAHRDTLGLVMARLDLSMESGDPLVQGDRELLMDSQERQVEDKVMDQVKDGNTVAMEMQDMTMGNLGTDLQGVVEKAVTIQALFGQGTELKISKCQFTASQNLVQFLGRVPIIIVKCVQKIGRNQLINNQDLDIDSQTSIQLIYMDPVNSISEIHLLKIR